MRKKTQRREAAQKAEPFPGGQPGAWSRVVQFVSKRWNGLLERSWIWLALFLVAGAWLLAGQRLTLAPDIELASIAFRDFTAPRELLIPDEAATLSRRREARAAVNQVVDFDLAVSRRRDLDLASFFAYGRELLAVEPSEPVPSQSGESESGQEVVNELDDEPGFEGSASFEEKIRAATRLRLDSEQVAALRAVGFSETVETDVRQLVERLFLRGIAADKADLMQHQGRGITLRRLGLDTEDKRQDLSGFVDSEAELANVVDRAVAEWQSLNPENAAQLARFVHENLSANVVSNLSETQRRRRIAEEQTPAVFTEFRKGQVIVRKGDVVSAEDLRTIQLASATGRGGGGQLLPILGSMLMLTLMASALWLGLRDSKVQHKGRQRLFSEILILTLSAVLLARFGLFLAQAVGNSFQMSLYGQRESFLLALPFAGFALVLVLLYGRRLSLLPTLFFCVLVEQLGGLESDAILLYSVAGSLAALYITDNLQFKSRSVMLRAGLAIAGVNCLAILSIAAFAGREGGLTLLGFDLLCGVLGGVLCAAVASFSISVFEALFGITTHIKLIELSNTNLPLLRRLALHAPGTFHHSLMVANLAKAGTEAVGADSLLAHVGALYHDIGKMIRPDYFIENQRPNNNPHDSLEPSMSVLILGSHIKDGIDLARDHHLPQPIVDAIAQHHGTRRMNFFYERAVERAAEPEEVNEVEFRYPGPKPQDRVMGIMMLADGVEAASRTLRDAAPAQTRGLVRRIVEDCLADGQLDETDLTLSDLREVSEAFIQVLSSLHHRRVDYPGFDFNADAAKPTEPGRIAS